MSSLASVAPEVVIHSVMPIFTFMSSTVLRHTDDYSAHVVDKASSNYSYMYASIRLIYTVADH